MFEVDCCSLTFAKAIKPFIGMSTGMSKGSGAKAGGRLMRCRCPGMQSLRTFRVSSLLECPDFSAAQEEYGWLRDKALFVQRPHAVRCWCGDLACLRGIVTPDAL